MANQIPEEALAAIEDVVRRHRKGASAPEILRALTTPIPLRTLQYRLKQLVTRNRLIMDGEGRWARYRMPDAAIGATAREDANESVIPLSEAGTAIRDYVRQVPETRKPVGYDRKGSVANSKAAYAGWGEPICQAATWKRPAIKTAWACMS